MRRIPHKLRRLINKTPGTPATMVFSCLSQSNWEGWSSDPQNTTALTNGYAYQYFPGPNGGAFLPLGRNLLGRTQGGPHSAFAQAWAAGAGGVVLYCDCAVGGSTLVAAAKGSLTGSSAIDYSGGTWDLADAANHYDVWCRAHMQAALAAAKKAGFDVRWRVVVSAIGESDAGANALSSGPLYKASYLALADRIAAEFSINAILLSELGTNGVSLASSNAFWNAIRSAQTEIEAARPTLIKLAFTDAKNFFDASKMVDTLHYTQTGYNEMGAGMAAAGLAFVPGLKMPAPQISRYAGIAKTFPRVNGFKRIIFDTARVGAINPQFYSDPTTPFAVTWLESTGSNTMRADQSLTWTLPSGGPRQVCCYVPDSIGSSGTVVLDGNFAALRARLPDGVVKLATFNLASTGAVASTFTMTLDDMLSFDPSLTSLGFGTAPRVVVTNAVLQRYSGLTLLSINTSTGTGELDLTLVPNLVNLQQQNAGLTTANVNTYLQALDANGLSNGSVIIPQSGAAPPSGAGATAKTALIGKGWTVTTD